MSQDSLTADEVANFLLSNPDFFEQHADTFAALKVPHPHKAQAISLGERQILTLRSRLKNHESQLQSLVYNASGNQKINTGLMQWCANMLAQENAASLPDMISNSLKDQFGLDALALQIWDLATTVDAQFQEHHSPEISAYADKLAKPYCGPLKDQPVASWFGENIQSVAIIPLKSHNKHSTIGLLVFGAEDPDRFTENMGTDFLELIARLSGAALSRLE